MSETACAWLAFFATLLFFYVMFMMEPARIKGSERSPEVQRIIEEQRESEAKAEWYRENRKFWRP